MVHQINFLLEVLNLKKNLQKNKVVTGKTPFLVIGPFVLTTLFILALTSDMTVFYGNDAFFILVLSTKKCFSSFLKKVFVFQKIYFRVKVLKTFKIPNDCHIKTCLSLKLRAIRKISSTVFRQTFALSVGFKMKPLRKSIFQC